MLHACFHCGGRHFYHTMANGKYSGWIDRGEMRRLLSLMGPLYIANLLHMGMGVIDTIVAGRAGATELAGVGLGASVSMPVLVAVGMVLTIMTPMISRLRGAGNQNRTGALLHSGMHLAWWLMAVELVALYLGSFIFDYVTDNAGMAHTARWYVYFMMLGVPASVMLRLIQGNFEGNGQVRPGMVAALAGLSLNIPANLAFVFGWGPIPAMGGAGCGLATALIHWAMMLGLLALMFKSRRHRAAAQCMVARRKANRQQVAKILRLGFPLGVASLCEITYFSALTPVIAPLGEVPVAAHQVVLNLSGVVFMLPLSLSIATSIRAAYHVGAHNRAGFTALARTAALGAAGIMALFMAALLFFRQDIVSLYTSEPEIIAIAMPLVALCAVYQFSDATQAFLSGLLRACHDTKALTWVNIVSYWLVGFPIAVLLIRTDWLCPQMGPAGAWVSFIVGLTLAAALLLIRFLGTFRRTFPRPRNASK